MQKQKDNLKKFLAKLINWEQGAFYIRYAPLGLVWIYYTCKAKPLLFFVNVNPKIEFSGFEVEPKKRNVWQATYPSYPETIHIKAGTDFIRVLKASFTKKMG